jgi:hypothetical protein
MEIRTSIWPIVQFCNASRTRYVYGCERLLTKYCRIFMCYRWIGSRGGITLWTHVTTVSVGRYTTLLLPPYLRAILQLYTNLCNPRFRQIVRLVRNIPNDSFGFLGIREIRISNDL